MESFQRKAGAPQSSGSAFPPWTLNSGLGMAVEAPHCSQFSLCLGLAVSLPGHLYPQVLRRRDRGFPEGHVKRPHAPDLAA